MKHRRTVQVERDDMMYAVADGPAIPQVEVMPSRGRRSRYDKSTRRPVSPSKVNRILASVKTSTIGALQSFDDEDSRKTFLLRYMLTMVTRVFVLPFCILCLSHLSSW